MDAGGWAPPDAAANISPAPNVAAVPSGIRVENCYVFKSRLQEYAQKAGLRTPEYHTLKEGPSHEPVFKSTVVIDNNKYDSLPGFFSRKAAEQSAAEVALMEIDRSIPATENIRAVQETGLCKNLLQEYAQKMNYAIPSYICTKQASGVAPFICTVEIGGIRYISAAARTKKEAEIKAARTALLAIQSQSEGRTNGAKNYIVVPGQRQVKEVEKRPIETPKPLKVKKSGNKKKWNKRKFTRKTDQTVDAEKHGAEVAAYLHQSDVPMQAAITADPSSDTIILQPGVEAKSLEQELLSDTVMLQPGEEARIATQVLPGVSAMLPHSGEAGKVEQEPFTDTAAVQPIEDVIGVKQEPSSNTAMLQPCEEARIAEMEPLRDTAMVQPNEEARSIVQEPLSNAEMLKPNEEARDVGHETLCTSIVLQPNGEATDVKEAPPSNIAMMQPEETRTIMQEAPINADFVQPNKEPMVENIKSVYEQEVQNSGDVSL